MKVYLNDLCPCGSGKKYKDCCVKDAMPKSTRIVGGFSVDLVVRNKDFIVNRNGAVVFMDESKQPILDFDEGSVVKMVLSIGFSKSRKPLATIQENDGAICYILPDWYMDWCTTYVGLAMSGMNLFPSQVQFSKYGNEYSVDIL